MERPANMLPNAGQVQNANMNGMQRPQSGNNAQQIHAQIMTSLRSKMHSLPPGWQQTFDMGQRANAIMQLVSQLRLLNQQTDKCIQIAENFEERCILESPSKDVYFQKIHSKLADIRAKRAQQVPQVVQPGQMGMPMNGGNMGMAQNNLANLGLPQNNGMGGMNMGMNMANQGMNMPNGQPMANGGQQNQNFPTQLQRPMQPSPLPAQQQQQQQQQQNFTMDPSALQNPQMSVQASNMNQPNNQQAPNANQSAQPQPGQVMVQQQIAALARQLYNNTSEERRAQLRVQAINQQNEQGQPAPPGVDPLHRYFMIQAREMFVKQRRAAQMGQAASQNGGMQMGTNGGMATAMQQTASQAGAAPNFDFSSMLGQQANAIKSQESGEQVVPASNNPNNLNLGGQMNMSQGANPQATTNQNNQGGNNAQLQQFLAMQEKQRREQQQRQLQEKAQQGMQGQGVGMAAQQNQLRGQPGGLGGQNALNGGQIHSPAMNMLNRPMAPPGQQQNPSTPQQNRQGMSQTPVNGANQLVQHHQSMVNQNNQQMNQGAPAMTQRQQMLDSLPPGIRERLSQLGPEQVNIVLARYYAQNNNAMNNQQGAGGNQPNANMGAGPMGNRAGAGMHPNMQSAVPGFNSQPPMNQQGQQATNDQSLQLQQRMQQHQQNQFKQKAFDLTAFPKSVLSALGLAPGEGINEWGKLRQHITQNQAVLPSNMLQRMQNAQNQYFEAHPDEARQAIVNLQQRMQQMALAQQQAGQQGGQQQPPAARPPSAMAVPTGPPPQAQMVPPNPALQQQQQQQQQPNQQGLNLNQQVRIPPQPPTQQDIQTFRQKIPNAQNMTDDQIRNAIMHRKMQQANQQAISLQQQQQLRLQMQRAQGLAGVQQPKPPQGNQQPQPQQQQPQQQQHQAPQGQRPAQPTSAAAAKQQQQQSNTPVQGQKRPQSSTDDVMEIPNPNVPAKAPQAPPMRANASQQPAQQPQGQMRAPTQEEFNKMTPDQQSSVMAKMRQMEALRKAQGAVQQGAQPAPGQPQPNRPQGQAVGSGPGQMPPEEAAKVRALYNEVANAHPKGPAVQLDAKGREQVQASLRKLWPLMPSIFYTTPLALRIPSFGEKRVREAIRYHILIQQNAADPSGAVKEYYSVTPAELKQAENFIGHYAAEIKAIREAASKQGQAGANGAQNQQARQQAPAKPQQPQQAPAKPQPPTRKASASTKAPPAPTDNKTFDWGSPSPHGVPKYQATSNELTADKLKIPAQKKRKTGPQSETQDVKTTPQGSAAAASPKVVDVKPQPSQQEQPKMQPVQTEPKAPEEKAKFKCDDVFCDASVVGFETEAQLKEHRETVHQPIEDPLKFLLDSAATALGVDQDGNPLPEKKEVGKTSAPARTAPLPASAGKKGSQTPAPKPGSATGTPVSGGKIANKTAAPTPGKKAADAKTPAPAADGEESAKTLYEVMCERIGVEVPTAANKEDQQHQQQPVFAQPEVSTANPDDTAWLSGLQSTLSNSNDFEDADWSYFNDVTDWSLGPGPELDSSSSPELTPSDQSEASRDSDISRNERLRINLQWDPFGCGDTYVPEILRLGTLGLGGGDGEGGKKSDVGDDVAMQDGDGGDEGKGKDAAQKADDDKWNWDADLDWDSMFGADAGLDPNVDDLYNAMHGL